MNSEISKRKPLSDKAKAWLKARASKTEWLEIVRREGDAEAVYAFVAEVAPACHAEMIEAGLMPLDLKIYTDHPKVTEADIISGRGRWADASLLAAEQQAAIAELRRRAQSVELEIMPEAEFDPNPDIEPWGFAR